MNGLPAERTQVDGMGDYYSDLTAMNTGDEPSQVRQELAHESDINFILSRFGIQTQQRVMVYGQEIDYNLDLQEALAAIASAKTASFNVPDELKTKYPTWREVLEGAENGTYERDLQTLADRDKKAAEAAPSTNVTPNA